MLTQTRGQALIAPTLLPFEVGNICWKKIRRQSEQEAEILFIFRSWLASHTLTFRSAELSEILPLARLHDLTFYDASYLWLAQDRSATLISLDRRLLRAAHRVGVPAPSPQH